MSKSMISTTMANSSFGMEWSGDESCCLGSAADILAVA